MCDYIVPWEDHMNTSYQHNDTIDYSWEGGLPNSTLCLNGSINNSSLEEKKASKFSLLNMGMIGKILMNMCRIQPN